MLSIIKTITNFFVKIGTKHLLINKTPTIITLLLVIAMFSGVINKDTAEYVMMSLSGTSNTEIAIWIIVIWIARQLQKICEAYVDYIINTIKNKATSNGINNDK